MQACQRPAGRGAAPRGLSLALHAAPPPPACLAPAPGARRALWGPAPTCGSRLQAAAQAGVAAPGGRRERPQAARKHRARTWAGAPQCGRGGIPVPCHPIPDKDAPYATMTHRYSRGHRLQARCGLRPLPRSRRAQLPAAGAAAMPELRAARAPRCGNPAPGPLYESGAAVAIALLGGHGPGQRCRSLWPRGGGAACILAKAQPLQRGSWSLCTPPPAANPCCGQHEQMQLDHSAAEESPQPAARCCSARGGSVARRAAVALTCVGRALDCADRLLCAPHSIKSSPAAHRAQRALLRVSSLWPGAWTLPQSRRRSDGRVATPSSHLAARAGPLWRTRAARCATGTSTAWFCST